MNFSILNITTNKVISGSNVRLVGESSSPNLRIETLTTPEVAKSYHLPSTNLEDDKETHEATEQASPNASNLSPKKTMPIIDPNNLVGSTFLILQEDIQRPTAKIDKDLDD